MPRAAADRGPAALRDHWRFQLLRLDVEIRADARLANEVEFLAHNARHPFAPSADATYIAEPEGVDWVIALNGAPIARLPGPAAAADALFARVSSDAVGLMPDRALLRAALGADCGRRFLLLGKPGAGLTALSVRLLYQGASIEGDAFVAIGEHDAIALPRRFVLRFGAGELLPEIADLLERLPARPDGAGATIWAFDPADAGFDWTLRQGPVDMCVLIEPNHGGRSMLSALPHYEMARQIISRCSAPPAGGRAWLRSAVALADASACFRLQLGQLDDAVELLRGAR